MTILLVQMGWLVCDHDVQDQQNSGVSQGLGEGHYQNKRPCKAEPSAARVLVRPSLRGLHQVITGAGFFLFFWHLLGITEKRERGILQGVHFAFQNDLHSMHALLLEISGMYHTLG